MQEFGRPEGECPATVLVMTLADYSPEYSFCCLASAAVHDSSAHLKPRRQPSPHAWPKRVRLRSLARIAEPMHFAGSYICGDLRITGMGNGRSLRFRDCGSFTRTGDFAMVASGSASVANAAEGFTFGCSK